MTPSRRSWSFSLRTLFVVVTIAAIEGGLYNLADGYREPMLVLSILCFVVAIVAYSFVGPWRGYKRRPPAKARARIAEDSPATQADQP